MSLWKLKTAFVKENWKPFQFLIWNHCQWPSPDAQRHLLERSLKRSAHGAMMLWGLIGCLMSRHNVFRHHLPKMWGRVLKTCSNSICLCVYFFTHCPFVVPGLSRNTETGRVFVSLYCVLDSTIKLATLHYLCHNYVSHPVQLCGPLLLLPSHQGSVHCGV